MKVLDLFSGYVIREDGEVRNKHGRVISQHVCHVGYIRVELWCDGKGKKHLLHRLLAKAFIPNPDNKPEINHIDGCKLNNDITNLEWVTRSENQLHAYAIGLQKGYRKSVPLSPSHRSALCGSRWRGERRIYWCDGRSFSAPEAAAQHFSVSRQTVYNRSNSGNFPTWKIEILREEK